MKKLLIALLLFSLITCPVEGAWRKPKAWESKPPVGSTIDWSNPLTKGLVFCALMNEGGGLSVNNLVSPIKKGTLVNSPSWKTDKRGLGINYPSYSSYAITFPASTINLNEGTLVILMTMGFAYSGGNFETFFDSDNARHAFYHSFGATTISMYNDGRQNSFDTPHWAIGDTVHLAFVYKKTGNIQNLYYNSVSIASGGSSGTWGSTALGTNGYIGNRFSLNQSVIGTIFYVYLYNRALSPSEIQSLYVSPYQFIIPPKRRIVSQVIAAVTSVGALLRDCVLRNCLIK